MNFHQLSVWSADLPSTLVNFLCSRENFLQPFVPPGDLPSNSVTLPFGCKTLHTFLSTFRATKRPSINFRIRYQVSEIIFTLGNQ